MDCVIFVLVRFHKVQRKIKAKIQDKEIGEEVASDDERIIKAEKLRAKVSTVHVRGGKLHVHMYTYMYTHYTCTCTCSHVHVR